MAICYEINKKNKTLTLNEFDEVCCNISNIKVNDESYCNLFKIYTSFSIHLFDTKSDERFQEIKLLSMIDKAKEFGYPDELIKCLIELNALGYKLIVWRD